MTFAEVLKKHFPQISSEEAHTLHRKFSDYNVNPNWLFGNTGLNDDQIAQGDILIGLYAGFWDFDNKAGEAKFRKRTNCHGIILTTTCGNEREEHLTFVPLVEAEVYFSKVHNENLKDSIRKNIATSILFLPATNDSPSFIGDFGLSCAITKNFLTELRRQGQLRKIQSLTLEGYYFFLAKLTLHLMRPETAEVNRMAVDLQ